MRTTSGFYDPLYKIDAFPKGFWEKWDSVAYNFHKIIGTYEVNRLNFLRLEGISWLAFPAASYTRFLSTLGCCYLADVSLEHVRVYPRSKKSSPWLSAKLEDVGLLSEFRLAALLRNIGTFPFNNTIDNNHTLFKRYADRSETKDIVLRHENFTLALICGDKSNPIFRLYKKYLNQRVGYEPDKQSLISNLLKDADLRNISREWLTYLIDPDQKSPKEGSNEKKKLARLVRHLIRGLIDIGIMDRTSRASYNICGGVNLINSRNLLSNLLLNIEQGNKKPQLIFVENGAREAIDAIYAVQNVFSRYVQQNPIRMAYEAMLNAAIDRVWDLPEKTDSDKDFKSYFPFMTDEEFLGKLSEWNDDTVKKMIRRIRNARPYHCIGRFKAQEFDDKSVSENKIEQIQNARRDEIIQNVKAKYPNQKLLIRLSDTFGRPIITKAGQSLAACRGPESQRYAWLDPYKIYTSTRFEDIENGTKTPQRMDTPGIVPERLLELIGKHEKEERLTFWLFAPEEQEMTGKKGEETVVGQSYAAQLDVNYVREV